jgi:UDP-N-acetylmuramate--alanine ligase
VDVEASAGSLIDLSRPRRVHIVGVGGAGMSAIATVLAAMGHEVTGSDLKASAALDRLRAVGVTVTIGHRAEHLGDAEAVAISTAIPGGNPEVTAARERGIVVLRRADVLAAIASCRRTAAVSGTKGKTTTTSMLALILVEAGMRPSFIVGGDVNEVGGGAVWDRGPWFVVEADESDGTFLELGADAVLVTNVEPDHLDHWRTFDALLAGFDQFLASAKGPRLVCADDPWAATLGQRVGATTYGTSPGSDWQLTDLVTGRSTVVFSIVHDGAPVATVRRPVPGLHNARNAAGALAMAVLLGAPIDAAVRALERYAGVARRFQFRGEADGVTFIDDYAHLPTAVAAALDTVRRGHWRRVVAVFQPHRFTRTAALADSFAHAFVDADVLVVTDIYPAGEPALPGVSGKLIVDAVLDAHPTARLAWLPARHDVADYLVRVLRPGDVCLTLGAGDVTSLPDELIERLRDRGHG